MFMEENLAEFELKRSPVGSLPDLPDPMAELSWIRYAQKCPKTRSGKEVSRVEFPLSLLCKYTTAHLISTKKICNISVKGWKRRGVIFLPPRASLADIFGHFHIARFNQGFIKSKVRSDPSPKDRVIVRIRDRCTASCMF
jgi:hypothetical protein